MEVLIYLDRVKGFRVSSSLLVNFGPARQGAKPSTQTLSRWIRSVILLAYKQFGLSSPLGIQGRSTRGMSASMAEVQGASLQEIFRAATWAVPSIFVSHYRVIQGPEVLDLLGSQVLASVL